MQIALPHTTKPYTGRPVPDMHRRPTVGIDKYGTWSKAPAAVTSKRIVEIDDRPKPVVRDPERMIHQRHQNCPVKDGWCYNPNHGCSAYH